MLPTPFRAWLSELWTQRTRTALTLGGIGWGTFSVVGLLAFGNGTEDLMMERARGLGGVTTGLTVEEARLKLAAKRQKAMASKPMDERERQRRFYNSTRGMKAEDKAERFANDTQVG